MPFSSVNVCGQRSSHAVRAALNAATGRLVA